ncbi:MAG: hypothetical protein IJ584_03775 [Bacteroidales bacterium]|nr:hypothetical protein [Bacteroidales bacterium]
MREAYDGMYDEYEREYGEENREKLILEAAGKLVAKQLFREEQIKTNKVKSLVTRIIDAIKNFFRKFRHDEIQNAIFEANDIASKVARGMLGGRLIDDMSLANVASTGKFLNVQMDLSEKTDILSKLLAEKIKQLAIFKKRQGPRAKGKQSAPVKAVEIQVAKLEAGIRNNKVESTVVTYLSDSLAFLQQTEKSLLDAVASGRPVNSICRKLNIVRDTLYNVSKAMTDIEAAIRAGEIQDSVGLSGVMKDVGLVLQKFYGEFDDLSMKYFEEMLSSVYGKEGKTVTIGKDKGKVVTIHDMATKADNDVSFMSRMFNSLAHCGDYVLLAVDDMVKNAKIQGRRNTEAIRPTIEAALAKLKKETGSTDQSFMFEWKRFDGSDWCNGKPDDGKLHRTGRYLSEKESQKLSPAQKAYYDTIMAVKKEVEQFIPESLQDEDRMIMMRKYTMDRFKDAEGAKGKALEAWEGLKNRVLDTSEDLDYDYHQVKVDFQNNRIDTLPIKFIYKGANETYDDMTDDVATSLMAYAGMACEYNAMNGIIDVLENARYMAAKRDIVQKTGRRTQRETVEDDNYRFDRVFTKKQAQTRLQQMLDDYFQMHVYGHIRANEGTFGRTRISKRKVVDTVNAVTSYSQMAVNIPQRISNILTGQTQQIIEAARKSGAFSGKSLRWAIKEYMKESGDRLAQTGKTDYDNKLSLMAEYFDFHQDNGRYDPKYKKGRMSRIFNSSLLYAGLTMGEDYLALTTALAMAHEYKMLDDKGQPATLWDAYEVKYVNPTEKTGAYLAFKDGYKKADGSEFTAKDEIAFGKKVAAFNFEMQGIYNLDDKSAIQQYAFGALIIMYRKWIAPALKRRYAGVQYNRMKDDYDEGYHHTMGRVIIDILRDAKDQVTEEEGAAAMLNIIEDIKALKTSIMLNWNNLTEYERSNCKRSIWEIAIVIGLYAVCAGLMKLPPEPDEDNRTKALKWWDQTLMSQLLRLRTEIGSQAPTPMMLEEGMRILRSPLAAIEPLSNALNVFQLMYPPNYLQKVQGGRYQGRTKAYKYFRELPIISMAKKVDNFIDPSPLINYFSGDAIY